jgi:hypothetical protein
LENLVFFYDYYTKTKFCPYINTEIVGSNQQQFKVSRKHRPIDSARAIGMPADSDTSIGANKPKLTINTLIPADSNVTSKQ